MNYFTPSYYMNGNMGGYPAVYSGQYPLPVQTQQSTFSSVSSMQPSAPPQGLNGKIVDSEDVVKATEVPIGGYGIFPKADLSEIYIKSWNNNGTTSVITFKPIIPEPQQAGQTNSENNEISNLLLQKIDLLENKLDMFLSTAKEQPQPQPQQQVTMKSQEVMKNGF